MVLPTMAVAVSFALLAVPVVGPLATVAMSALVWAGTAQFATLSILAAGGGLPFAAGAALLANARFLPMGFAMAPSMSGGPLRRFGQGALLTDASFLIAQRGDGTFDVRSHVWAAPAQYVSWVGGTVLGVVGARLIGDPERWGLDVMFPIFYLGLLLPEVLPRGADGRRRPARRSLLAAGLGAVIAVALVPVAPPGVPVLAAATAALVGLPAIRRRDRPTVAS